MNLFLYPPLPHVRRHGPRGYADYSSYKDWLRDDFAFRCVYCLDREVCYPSGHHAFGVDHVVPQAEAPDRVTDYRNLVYACVRCNACKSDARRFPDPSAVAFGGILRVRDDGVVVASTRPAERMVRILQLNTPARIARRREFVGLFQKLRSMSDAEARRFAERLAAFPDDLPDLAALRPPGGNSQPDGVSRCWYARRRRGDLPATFEAP